MISVEWEDTEPLDVLYEVPVGSEPAELAKKSQTRGFSGRKRQNVERYNSHSGGSAFYDKQAENPETSRRRKTMLKALWNLGWTEWEQSQFGKSKSKGGCGESGDQTSRTLRHEQNRHDNVTICACAVFLVKACQADQVTFRFSGRYVFMEVKLL